MTTCYLEGRLFAKVAPEEGNGAASPEALSRVGSDDGGEHALPGLHPRHSFFFNAESRAQRHGFMSELGFLSTFSGAGVQGAQQRRVLTGSVAQSPMDSAASHPSSTPPGSAATSQFPLIVPLSSAVRYEALAERPSAPPSTHASGVAQRRKHSIAASGATAGPATGIGADGPCDSRVYATESSRGQRPPRRPARLLLDSDQKAFSNPLEEIAAGVEG